ncbi:MAG: ATP-binding protein [Pseudomonadota bacterium]
MYNLLAARSVCGRLMLRAAAVVCLATGIAHANGLPTGTACLPAWFDLPNAASSDVSTFVAARGNDGFLYFGGLEGLYRIEGGRIRGWFPDVDDANSLPAGYVGDLAPAPGGLWVGTSRGLAWFDHSTESFEPVAFLEDTAQTPKVYGLLFKDDRLYIGHNEGGTIIDATTRERIADFETGGTGSRRRVQHFAEFRGTVIAVSYERPVLVSPSGNTERLTTPDGNEIAINGYTAAIAPDGSLWMTHRGAQLVNVSLDASQKPVYYDRESLAGLPEGTLQELGFDPDGDLWIASNSALSQWQAGAEHPQPCRSTAIPESALVIATSALSRAADPYFFVGSLNRAPLVTRETAGVRRLVNGEAFNAGIPESGIWSTLLDREQRVYVGTLDGLYRETSAGSDEFDAVAPATLGELRVYALRIGPTGKLWVGTHRGLFVVDDNDARRIPLVSRDDGRPTRDITYYLDTYGERMLAATEGGLVVIDAATETVTFLYRSDAGTRAANNAPLIDTQTPRFWHVDVAGDDVYGVGDDGVYRLDIDAGSIAASTVDSSRRGDLKFGTLFAAAAHTSGRVFVAADAGLVVTDRDFANFEYITDIDGQRFGSLVAAEQAPDGSIWFAGKVGVARHDPTSGEWRLFSSADGLHASDTQQNGLTITSSGLVMSANDVGVSIMDPALIETHTPSAPQLIHAESGGRTIPFGDGAVEIGPDARDLSLSFAVPDLRVEDSTRLVYRIGKDVPSSIEQSLRLDEQLIFPRLDPGRYVFEGRVVQPGVGTSPVYRHVINVKAFWWETSAAYAVAVLMLLALIAAAFAWRARRIARRYELIGDERRRIAQDFHDSFMQEVFGALMIGRTLEGSSATQNSATRLVSLLESATDSARASVNELSDRSDDASLADALRAHNPAQTVGRDAANIQIEELGDAWPLRRERAFFLSRAAKEAITNAVKHARASSIEVTLEWQRMSLRIQIVDNGIGFDVTDARQLNSFGLEAMERLAKAGRAEFTLRSSRDEGTSVTITARRYAI